MSPSHIRLTQLSALLISCALAGCSSYSSKSASVWNDTGSKADTAALSRTQTLMYSGAEFLQNGEYDKAQKVFKDGLNNSN